MIHTDPSACRSCGAAIWWALTDMGKRTPVDAKPDPEGKWVLLWRGGKLRVVRYDPEAHAGPEWKRRTSHFATCPNADRHRGKEMGRA